MELCLSGGLKSYCELDIFYLLIQIHSPSFPVFGPGWPTYMGGMVFWLWFGLDQWEALAGDSRGWREEREAEVFVLLALSLWIAVGWPCPSAEASSPARQLSASQGWL